MAFALLFPSSFTVLPQMRIIEGNVFIWGDAHGYGFILSETI